MQLSERISCEQQKTPSQVLHDLHVGVPACSESNMCSNLFENCLQSMRENSQLLREHGTIHRQGIVVRLMQPCTGRCGLPMRLHTPPLPSSHINGSDPSVFMYETKIRLSQTEPTGRGDPFALQKVMENGQIPPTPQQPLNIQENLKDIGRNGMRWGLFWEE